MNIPDDVLALLREPSLCYVSTIMPDGSPQLTQPGNAAGLAYYLCTAAAAGARPTVISSLSA